MAREIKFRGFNKESGKWLYGSLINNAFEKDKTKEPCLYIFDNDKEPYDSFEDIALILDYSEIEPETLGQYTGFKDSRGEDIYENDVLECKMAGFETHIEIIEVKVTFYPELCALGLKTISPDTNYESFGFNSPNLLSMVKVQQEVPA